MKREITDERTGRHFIIRRAAQREAEAWHDLCQMVHIYHCDEDYRHQLEQKWEATREHLADTMNLRGNDRYRAQLIYQALRYQRDKSARAKADTN